MKTSCARIRIFVFCMIISVLSAVFLYLDFSRCLSGTIITPVFSDPSRLIKRVVSFICLIMVITAGNDAVDKRDHRNLKIIFSGIFIGDLLLLFNMNRSGIILFFFVQILLFIRHYAGFWGWITDRNVRGNISRFALIVFIVGIAESVLHYYVFSPLFSGYNVYPLIIVYSIVLGVSLIFALCAQFVGRFPGFNGRLIAAGMVCFFLCDCTVGIRMAGTDAIVRTYATSFTWVFYAPALVLLAVSGYKFNKVMCHTV